MKRFFFYFCVGGTSALIEWTVFALLLYFLNMPYLAATAIAFIFSTSTNWYFGRTFVFNDSKEYKDKKLKEYFFVFCASAIGLVFNILLMCFFVEICGMSTKALETVAKIMSTGIVFIWNFLARKKLIYRC